MLAPVALADVRWRSAAEGGRRSGPPPGPLYAAVGFFAEDSLNDAFSVVLRYDPARTAEGSAAWPVELSLLCPENLPEIVARLAPDKRLLIAEGKQIVADCLVRSVRMVDRARIPFVV